MAWRPPCMKNLSLDTKLLLGAFTGTFALVLALGLRAPADASAAGTGDGQQAEAPSAPAAAVNQTARLGVTQPGAGAAQAVPNLPPPPPVEPTPPEVIEADRWAVGEPPNNNY
jgi:hypothetical protein